MNKNIIKYGLDKNFAYSFDGVDFYRVETFAERLDDEKITGKIKVTRGKINKLNHSDFISGRRIIEQIKENCWDKHGEYSEDYLDKLSEVDTDNLEEIIENWLVEAVGEIKFFGVKKMEKVELEIK